MDSFKTHYSLLRDYLSSYLSQLGSTQRERNSAKEKLSRLPMEEFVKVSTDVYDEINRRLYDSQQVPFLPVRADLLPKRNQARQKMATLSVIRFQELASEVLYEIERRFTWMVEDYDKSKKMDSKVSQSESMDLKRIHSPDIHQSDSTIWTEKPREHSLKSKPSPLSPPLTRLNIDDMDRMRADYEIQISKLEKQLSTLSVDPPRVLELEQELKREKDLNHSLQSRYEKVRQELDDLKYDYHSQQKMTESMRLEAANLLDEVKTLSLRNKELEDSLSKSVASPSSHVPRIGSPMGSPITSSVTPSSGSIKKSNSKTNSSSLVSKMDQFYDSINKLTSSARSDQPTSVLIAMKSVLLSCKSITQESDSLEQHHSMIKESDRNRLRMNKEEYSSSLNTLMDLAKDHASGKMSLQSLDSAVNRLTRAVEDVITVLKYYDMPGGTNVWATPPDSPKPALSKNTFDLKIFLEEKTDDTAHAIQELLLVMRTTQNCSGPDLKRLIREIIAHINVILNESRDTFSVSGDAELISNAKKILNSLSTSKNGLDALGDEILHDSGNKSIKQRIANSSYEIAKHIKELLSCLE